jgi:phosphoribosylaminoimidazole (AIR) synthetase
LGKVTLQEAREVWNLGNGMLVVVAKKDADKTIEALNKNKIAAKVAGVITSTGKIEYA